MKQTIIFGNIITMDEKRPFAKAAVVKNGVFAYIGGAEVDYRGQNTVKYVQNEKYSAKSADFLRFLLYLCRVIDDFACLDLQH